MRQIIRIYTPEFLEEVQKWITERAQVENAFNPIEIDPQDPRIQKAGLQLLEQMWFDGRILPENVTIPDTLITPIYVEYEFSEDNIGLPALPTMVPSTVRVANPPQTYVNSVINCLEKAIAKHQNDETGKVQNSTSEDSQGEPDDLPM